MNIVDFIQNNLFLPRLKQHGCLVVYDPSKRCRSLSLAMASEDVRVVDCSESSIESREAALLALRELGAAKSGLKGLLVYVPTQPPTSDDEKQKDPFAIYTVCGGVFPDGAGDEYEQICLRAKPDHANEIRRIFKEDSNPDFSVIDKVGGGTGWPTLRDLLRAESARDILLALMAPSDMQKDSLGKKEGWVPEAHDLFRACMGLSLVTKAKSWTSIADELWRFVLFSEFVFDLPGPLPEALTNVPRAKKDARHVVEDICDSLRNDQRTQGLYISRAETVQEELNLQKLCESVENLGRRDTFPFEERAFLKGAVESLKGGDLDAVRNILTNHTRSVWTGKGESQAQWGLVQAALSLLDVCDGLERQLSDRLRNQDTLLDFYIGYMREADRFHREFEQAAGDYIGPQGILDDLAFQARKAYRQLVQKVQPVFVKHMENAGWPPTGRLANADVFDRLVPPQLQESGRRVALFLIDALRYELGVELEKQLADGNVVELQAAFAQLPSVTRVGMASLLPGAGQNLWMKNDGGEMLPMMGDLPMDNVTRRMDFLRKRYGQRFAEKPLKDFVKSTDQVDAAVELLVLRSAHMDAQMENDPEAALKLVHDTLKRIRVAIHKLREMGFNQVVIATDHGFFLNIQPEAGEVGAKPQGNWLNLHERSLLGDGTSDATNFVIPAERVGVRGDFKSLSGPTGMVPYRAGLQYFHGGASLQEAVVPVISLRLDVGETKGTAKAKVKLSYKQGAKRITTRLPVLDVLVTLDDLFAFDSDFEILLEAHDKKGNVIGEAKLGGLVNPATGTVNLKPNVPAQVTMKMEMDYEGKFTIKALDPATMTVYDKLELETDYAV